MPNYDYKCRECGVDWTTFHSIKDNAESLGLTCPECDSPSVYVYYGNLKTIPIHFKGTGFSINDHALDAIGFPKHYRENPEIRKKIEDL